MSDARLTDERLKSHLNGRQPDRERMCLAILGIETGFSQIEPRRPEGGPDGGRDIQCIQNGLKCFGAVGFKNSAHDSDQQVREIKGKFKDDLNSALDAEADLKAFVFFTNVDLTPAHQVELRNFASAKGAVQVEIYWRERIRVLLDSPEGYAIRLSFLDIPLSDAEQKVFFSRFGKELQALISGKLESVENRIEEIQFRNWNRGRCRSISVDVKFKKLYRTEGTNHEPFRFALRLHRVLMYGEGELFLGCYSVIHQDERRADFEVKRFIYSDTGMLPDERRKHKIFPNGTRIIGQPFHSVGFGIAFGSPSPLVTEYGLDIMELNQYVIDFYCDAAWDSRVDRVEVWYDDYLAYEFVNDGKRVRSSDAATCIPHWPEEASDLSRRPVQYWSGWPHGLDRVRRRKRVGES